MTAGTSLLASASVSHPHPLSILHRFQPGWLSLTWPSPCPALQPHAHWIPCLIHYVALLCWVVECLWIFSHAIPPAYILCHPFFQIASTPSLGHNLGSTTFPGNAYLSLSLPELPVRGLWKQMGLFRCVVAYFLISLPTTVLEAWICVYGFTFIPSTQHRTLHYNKHYIKLSLQDFWKKKMTWLSAGWIIASVISNSRIPEL